MHGLPLLPVLEKKVARENKRHANGRSNLLLSDTGPEQRIHRWNRSRFVAMSELAFIRPNSVPATVSP